MELGKDLIFARNVEGLTALMQNAVVGIAGCGGLGSNIAVALTRAGIGKLILLDFDIIEPSNLNRQYFFLNDVGKLKVDALSKHLKNINSEIIIEKQIKQIDKEDTEKIFYPADILIEAFDRAESKKFLIESWVKAFPDKPVIVGNGLSGFGNTDLLKVQKVGNIYFCGDGFTNMDLGLTSARVAIVANMQANLAIEIIAKKGGLNADYKQPRQD